MGWLTVVPTSVWQLGGLFYVSLPMCFLNAVALGPGGYDTAAFFRPPLPRLGLDIGTRSQSKAQVAGISPGEPGRWTASCHAD
jgi:hypothetical protein